MNLEPSAEQLELVDAVKSVCQYHFSMETLHQLAEDFSADTYEAGWRALEELGLFQLMTPEGEDEKGEGGVGGGVGLGFQEAALVFEELGRNVVPGPILSTFLVSHYLKETAAKRVEILTSHNQTGSEKKGGGGFLVVPNFHLISHIVYYPASTAGVESEGGGGAGGEKSEPLVVETKDLDFEILQHPLDPLTPVAKVRVGDIQKPGKPVVAANPDPILPAGAVLLSAFQTGLAEGALNLAVTYAKERQQFGVPIGSFQAVKHLCADMLTQVEVARAAVYAAALVQDDPDLPDYLGDTYKGIHASAKIAASKAASFCGQSCIQVFGGMGYTWEANPHLYLKRAWACEHLFVSSGIYVKVLLNTMLKSEVK